MLLRRFQTPGIAHVAYLVGDGGEAAVVDPRRDLDEVLAAAREEGVAIRYVVLTHRQEDFVMGAAELARLTSASIVAGEHPLFGRADVRLADGDELPVGGLRLRALHTPGHTPESTCYALFVASDPARALGVFTGDTLFLGETGRTDLTDPAKTGEHAGMLWDAVHGKLLPLGDQAIVWPAHGSGSVCGGNIADRDDGTIGFERASNPVFTKARDEFVRAKIDERLPRPPYFRHMEKVNLEGGLPPRPPPDAIPLLSAQAFAVARRGAVVIDTRDPEAFAGGHVPGSVNVWLKGVPVFGGWVADHESRVLLVAAEREDVATAAMHLARIGIDGVEGALANGFDAWRNAGMPIAYADTTDPRTLERAESVVLDVRDDAEFEGGHIPGAKHLFVGYVDEHLDRILGDLRKKPTVVVTCSVGHRAGVVVSLLLRRGIANVKNLLGGMTAWKKLELPTETGRDGSITTPEIEGVRR